MLFYPLLDVLNYDILKIIGALLIKQILHKRSSQGSKNKYDSISKRRGLSDGIGEGLFGSNAQAGRFAGQIHAKHNEFRSREAGGLGNGSFIVNFQSFYNSNSPNSTCLSMERSADLLKR